MTKQQKKEMWRQQYDNLMTYDDEVRKDRDKNAKTKKLMRGEISVKIHQAEENLRSLGALPKKPSTSGKKVAKKTATKKTTAKRKKSTKGRSKR